MAENLKVTLPGGYTLALENVDAAGVPDITQNAGENVLQAEADAQKPVTQEGAEYDAAAEADKGKEIENVQQVASQESENAVVAELARENGNTFYGMHIMNAAKKSGEAAFGITKAFENMKFASVKDAINSKEIKDAIVVAKRWADKKDYHLSSTKEVNENRTTLGEAIRGAFLINGGRARSGNDTGDQVTKNAVFRGAQWKLHTVDGACLVALPFGGLGGREPVDYYTVFIFFTKNANNQIFSKKLAVFKIAKTFATESYGVFAGLFAREAAEADAGETNPAATDNPVTPAEPDPETETADVNVEEDVEVTAEPAPAATEPAAPATEPAPETPATEPAPAATEPAAPATEPAPEAPATEPAPAATEPAAPAATEDDDAKAVESFYADFFKGWNK